MVPYEAVNLEKCSNSNTTTYSRKDIKDIPETPCPIIEQNKTETTLDFLRKSSGSLYKLADQAYSFSHFISGSDAEGAYKKYEDIKEKIGVYEENVSKISLKDSVNDLDVILGEIINYLDVVLNSF